MEQSQIGIANQEPFVLEFNLISKTEDIIDAIYDGKSFTQGLRVIKDNTTNVIKAKKTAGRCRKICGDIPKININNNITKNNI